MIRDLREVAQGLKTYFGDLSMEGKLVPCVFVNPSPQDHTSTRPIIILDEAGDYNDQSSWNNNTVELSVSVVDGKKVKELTMPEPIVVYYTVRLEAKLHSELTAMKTYLRKKLRRGAYLVLNNTECPIHTLSFRDPDSGKASYGENKDNVQRRFVGQYLIKVSTEMILEVQATKTVNKNIVRVKTKV